MLAIANDWERVSNPRLKFANETNLYRAIPKPCNALNAQLIVVNPCPIATNINAYQAALGLREIPSDNQASHPPVLSGKYFATVDDVPLYGARTEQSP
jgi:hypothetical protein